MEVTSPGGLIPQSLEIIRIMDRLTCTVNTLSRGVVSGTSVVIAAHGARGFRTAMANCRFSLTLDAAEISNPEQAEGQALVQKVVDLLVRDGSKGKEQILSWLRTGEGFSAQQALEVGLIDFISTPSPKAALAPAPRHR